MAVLSSCVIALKFAPSETPARSIQHNKTRSLRSPHTLSLCAGSSVGWHESRISGSRASLWMLYFHHKYKQAKKK